MNEIAGYVIPPLAVAFTTWIFARRKNKAEADIVEADAKANELENVDAAITIWREIAQNLQVELKNQQQSFDDKLDAISVQNKELLKKFTALEEDYNSLKKSYQGLKKQIEDHS